MRFDVPTRCVEPAFVPPEIPCARFGATTAPIRISQRKAKQADVHKHAQPCRSDATLSL